VQVVVESDHRAVEYATLVLQDGAAIKQDMALDRTGDYLYAITDTRVIYRYSQLAPSTDHTTDTHSFILTTTIIVP